ncbi:BQ2448_5540 [Microbotryum intermedium]|uniref:BQ2448_5540 protein n=1 Tax=Microbotryum intermedium TaxID=269621 RepID=A0A238F537_9BASI|nr:BQ2448_5540 [Microbotryum intermedium]
MLVTPVSTGVSARFSGRAGDLPGTEPGGSGTNLPRAVLIVATASSAFATVLSLITIWLQLKNYRKIALQRLVVRILVMVPIYSLSSLISLYSLDLAFFLDAVRDIYEVRTTDSCVGPSMPWALIQSHGFLQAFVIYCFFNLLVEYLGGERSLIILLHGRPPIRHPFPLSNILPPLDVSDPFTFLAIKRGILQYVQIKPFLAAATILLKALGSYGDGNLSRSSGSDTRWRKRADTYISIIYNVSVGLSLYCLALFWIATNADLKPYRPMPKFLCVKGIIFFSFWQGFGVSVLVKLGWLRSHRYETEALSLAIQDTLVCLEMPLFSFLHLYAFSYTDYIDSNHLFSGRLPVLYAIRDAFGYKDIFTDSITTVKGTGFSYRTFEPAAGGIHQGVGRDRRVAAGLRYAKGGQVKYWVELPGQETDAHGRKDKTALVARPLHAVRKALEQRFDANQGYAPLVDEVARKVVGEDQRTWVREHGYDEEDWKRWVALRGTEGEEGQDGGGDDESLGFGEVGDEEEEEDERLYRDAKGLEFGDWKYPVLDASKEEARRRMRMQDEARLEAGEYVSLSGGRQGTRKGKDKGKRKGKGRQEVGGRKSGFSYGALVEPETTTDAEVDKEETSTSSLSSSSKRRTSSRHRREPPTSADHPKPEGELLIHGVKHVLHAVSGGLYHSPHDKDPSDDDDDKEGSLGSRSKAKTSSAPPRPHRIASGAYDLVVADHEAEEEAQIKERRKGEPGAAKRRVYRQIYKPEGGEGDEEGGEGRGNEPAFSIRPVGNEIVEISRGEGKGGAEGEEGSIIVVREQTVTAVEADGPEGIPVRSSPPPSSSSS